MPHLKAAFAIAVTAAMVLQTSDVAVAEQTRATLYVLNEQEQGTVTVVDLTTRLVTDRIAVGSAPQGIAVAPDGRTAYVSNRGSSEISVIRTDLHRVTRTIRIPEPEPGSPFLLGNISMADDGQNLLVVMDYPDGCPFDSHLAVLDPSTEQFRIIGSVGEGQIHELAISREGWVYAPINGGCSDYYYYAGLGVFALVASPVRTRLELVTSRDPIEIGGIAIGGDNAFIALTAANEVAAVNRFSQTATSSFVVSSPTDLAMSLDETTLYVTSRCVDPRACNDGGALSFVDVAANLITGSIRLGPRPSHLALSPDRAQGFVSNFGGGSVSVVDLAARVETARLNVGYAPGNLIVFDRPVRTEPPACLDCNRDGAITIDEVVTLVNVVLGDTEVSACPILAADTHIDITHILSAIHHAIAGCSLQPVYLPDVEGCSAVAPHATQVGDRLFYYAKDDRGCELWVTDGTRQGTYRVHDIQPGGRDGISGSDLHVLDGERVLFVADDGEHGHELWLSDGSAAGTQLVKDICVGCSAFAAPLDFAVIVVLNGGLLFVASDMSHGAELWRTDGSTEGTMLIRDINPGPADGLLYSRDYSAFIPHFTLLDGVVLFSANDGATGFELWRSDGTFAGTALVLDINEGSEDSLFRGGLPLNPPEQPFPVSDGAARFLAARTIAQPGGGVISQVDLWQSDGTAVGTAPVHDQ